MSSEVPQFETKSARSMRGMETRTISKWEGEGWELVSQTPGKIQTEILFRRPKRKAPRGVLIAASAGVVVLLAVAVVAGIIGESKGGATEPAADQAAVVPTEDEVADEPVEDPADEVSITVENSPEFAELLGVKDYCDASVAAFAEAHKGELIEFDANVGAINNHDEYDTRYDILIGAGDFSEASQPGPFFQFRDVNPRLELNYVGSAPDPLVVGTNARVVAEVKEYEQSSCLFLLDPVETEVR